MRAKEAAAYCGLSVSAFHVWRKKWRIDCKINGKSLYARDIIDKEIDKALGVNSSSEKPKLTAFDRYRMIENEIASGKRKHGNKAA